MQPPVESGNGPPPAKQRSSVPPLMRNLLRGEGGDHDPFAGFPDHSQGKQVLGTPDPKEVGQPNESPSSAAEAPQARRRVHPSLLQDVPPQVDAVCSAMTRPSAPGLLLLRAPPRPSIHRVPAGRETNESLPSLRSAPAPEPGSHRHVRPGPRTHRSEGIGPPHPPAVSSVRLLPTRLGHPGPASAPDRRRSCG